MIFMIKNQQAYAIGIHIGVGKDSKIGRLFTKDLIDNLILWEK